MSCDHPSNAHVTDDHDGTIVCTACAHVINEQLYGTNGTETCQHPQINFISTSLVQDFGINNHFGWQVIEKATQLHNKKNYIFRTVNPMLKIAYVYLKASELCQCPRSICEISQLTHTSEAELYALQSKLNVRISPVKPQDLLERAIYQLKYVTYHDVKTVSDFINNISVLKTQTLAPKTVAAAALTIILEQRNCRIKPILLARAFKVNPKTVKRAIQSFLK